MIDPLLGQRTNFSLKSIRQAEEGTPRILRRGNTKFNQSRSASMGQEITYISSVSSVGFSGPVLNYSYEFKLKYSKYPGVCEEDD